MLKNRSSPSLQFLPTAAAMSLRPSSSYRGGRNQWRGRGFSNRPYAPVTDNIVNGNDDPNREFRPDCNPRPPRFRFRPNSDPPFNQNQSFQPRGQPPPPYLNPNQQFAPPPLYNQNQQFWRHGQPQPHFNPNQQFRPPPLYNQGQQQPSFDQNQQFRPQGQPPQPFGQFRPQQRSRQRPSKPLDYRNWEYAKPGPPPSCERFTVLSYNILADYLAINHRGKLYFHIPRHVLDWEFRKKNIMFELGLWSADILCFQEVDKFQDLEEDLKIRGYSGIWKMRTGEPVDGCAIFWRSSRFKLLHEEAIEFNKFGMRDNVAQICVLESLNEKCSAGSPPPACSEGHNKVIICNIHVLYNPRRGEIKLGQVRVLLDRAFATSKLWDDAPVVLCGDFNSTPKSSLYNFISEQKLDVSELPRNMISGQMSAEIPHKRPFTNTIRTQSTDNATQSPRRVDNQEVHKEEAGIKGDSTCSMSSQPECISDMPDLSASSLTDTMHEDKKTVPQLEAKEESEGNAANCTSESLENVPADAIGDGISLSEDHILVDETILTTSPDEPLEAVEDVSVGEDSVSFLSALHGPDGSDFVDDNETSEAELSLGTPDILDGSFSTGNEAFVQKPAYDPSGWTPMEIEAATGSSECTTMEHPLTLRSTYSEVKDYSGTRDSNGEPQVTSYHRGFQGTVDYIWRSKGLQTVKVLAPIPKHAMQWTPGFPTKRWGSDHVALVTKLAFNKEPKSQVE
ncbi:carbon catabolite repressor protein 4 homolog 6 [Cynara cardunculus var. scolymus]|uniref:carbon catabolite repressor protein 4 homolog 6 n=1 Tax=Cynara cardunculus var. scolymus TaxID=59895 RepID=UPI000D63073B|nr:carbon catabolite repressor protein 4 homolog 6 [Cynara cardunculus var. scolymus]